MDVFPVRHSNNLNVYRILQLFLHILCSFILAGIVPILDEKVKCGNCYPFQAHRASLVSKPDGEISVSLPYSVFIESGLCRLK